MYIGLASRFFLNKSGFFKILYRTSGRNPDYLTKIRGFFSEIRETARIYPADPAILL